VLTDRDRAPILCTSRKAKHRKAVHHYETVHPSEKGRHERGALCADRARDLGAHLLRRSVRAGGQALGHDQGPAGRPGARQALHGPGDPGQDPGRQGQDPEGRDQERHRDLRRGRCQARRSHHELRARGCVPERRSGDLRSRRFGHGQSGPGAVREPGHDAPAVRSVRDREQRQAQARVRDRVQARGR